MTLTYRLRQLVLVGGDTLCFFVGLWCALSLRAVSLASWQDFERVIPLFIGVFLMWIATNSVNGLYDLEKINNSFFFYRRIVEASIFSLVLGFIFFYLVSPKDIAPKTILVLAIVCGYGLSALWRLFYNTHIGKKTLKTNILYVGYTPEVQELIDITKAHPEKGFIPVALIDPSHEAQAKKIASVEIYRTLKTIRPAITNHRVNLVVIAPHLRQDTEALRELYELLFWPVRITNLPTMYEMITGRIPPSTFSEGWFLDHLKNKENIVYDKIRALIDYTVALILFPILVITFPFIALCIILTSKGPLFIQQLRVGKNGQQFTMYKFRSMYALSADGSAETGGAQFAAKNDDRITPIGKVLRKTRLDELPQLINILKGDLALIGPRPERPEFVLQLEEKMPYYSLRHTVKPGVTGWAAVQQQYTDSMETTLQKLQYDLFYIKNRSFILDLSIVLRTINVVIRMMGQ